MDFKNIKDQISSTKRGIGVFREMYGHMSPDCFTNIRKMIGWLFLSILASTLQPLAVNFTINGLVEKNATMILYSIIAFFILGFIGLECDLKRRLQREHFFGAGRWSLMEFTTRNFFKKSLGEHLSDGSCRGETIIQKGVAQAMSIEDLQLFSGLQQIGEFLLAFILLWFISVKAAFIMSILILIHCAHSLFINHIIVTGAEKIDAKWREVYRFNSERLRRASVVRTFCKEEEELQYMQNEFRAVHRDDFDLWSIFHYGLRAKQRISVFFLCAVMLVTAYDIYYGAMLGMFYPIIAWSNKIASHLFALGDMERRLNEYHSVENMNEFLLKPSEVLDVENPKIIEDFHGNIIFDNICYSYSEKVTGKPVEVLRNISFEAKKGEKIAIIAPSGHGKTTLIRLLLKAINPTSGRILLQEGETFLDLKEVQERSWRKNFSTIGQGDQFFDESILYNILYGCDYTPPPLEEIERLCHDCQVYEFGNRLTDGLLTRIGENGLHLSSGQGERLTWARAMAKKFSILIIDEGTSHLDARTEFYLISKLEEMCADKTLFMIAHRVATLKTCNKFIVLKKSCDLQPGESQIETIASSFEACVEQSTIFRDFVQKQQLVF